MKLTEQYQAYILIENLMHTKNMTVFCYFLYWISIRRSSHDIFFLLLIPLVFLWSKKWVRWTRIEMEWLFICIFCFSMCFNFKSPMHVFYIKNVSYCFHTQYGLFKILTYNSKAFICCFFYHILFLWHFFLLLFMLLYKIHSQSVWHSNSIKM